MIGLIRLFSLLPLGVMYALSSVLWPVVYYLAKYRRGVVRRNLTDSFPNLSHGEIKKLERKFYRSFTDIVLESVKMTSISRDNLARRMSFVNVGEVVRELENGEKISLFLGHLCNWEWVSSLPLHLPAGVRAGQVYHRLRDRAMDGFLLENRERMGAVCVEMGDIARRIKEFDIMGFIADQSPQRQFIRHRVPFLNRSTPVYVGAERLTKKYGWQAWFLDVRRVGRGYYEARFVRLEPDPAREFGITEAYYRCLENALRSRPEAYLWTHNRFKHVDRD